MKKYPKYQTLKKLLKTVKERKPLLFYASIFYALISVISPIMCIILPKVLLSNLMGLDPNLEYIIIVVISFIVLNTLFSFLDKFIINRFYFSIASIRINEFTNVADKLDTIEYKHIEDSAFWNTTKDAIDALNSNESGFEGCIHTLFTFPSRMLLMIGYIAFCLYAHYLVLIGLVVSVLVSVYTTILTKRFRYNNKEKLAASKRKIDYYAKTTQDFSYGLDVRLFNMEKVIENNYDNEIKSYLTVFKKIKNKEYFLGLVDLFFILLSDALIYGVLIYKVLNGLALDSFIMFLLLIVSASTHLKLVCNDLTFLVSEGAYVYDYYKFIQDETLNPSSGNIKKATDTLEIEFVDVSFKYPKTDNYIIKDLSFKIKKGEKVAIVGVNGAGKTTLVKLILGLFEPTSGQILVNGIEVKDYIRSEYLEMFSVVFQDINILSYSIKDNITLGNNENGISVEDCLKMVGLYDKVMSLEQKEETTMLKIIDQHGVVFSGGENQKIAIARALYKNANMVILDEPTSALDALAEEVIYQDFNKLIGHKTSLYISHRLSSTKFCDSIILFSGSGIKECGTHEQLMELKGEYYNMFVTQGKYYKEEV